ncbi:AAA family ATPase [Brucella sp. TWI432]
MKIIQFNAENIKRLVAVEIVPGSNLVQITGRNGQGKTSILDAIWWALDTNKVVQSRPLREGEEKGFVRLDLGEYIVTKTFKAKEGGEVTKSLTVQNRDGAKYGNPTELLSKFIGDLTFDPLAFSRMKAQDQVKALRALVPDYDFNVADAENKRDFDKRTDVNRKVRELGLRLDAIIVPDDAPTEAVSSADLMEELNKAMDHNTAVQTDINNRDKLNQRIFHMRENVQSRRRTIEDLQRRISEEQTEIEHAESSIAEMDKELANMGDISALIEIEPISQKIAAAEETNKLVAVRAEKEKLASEKQQAEQESQALTTAIDQRKEASAQAVKQANLPIDGLQLSEDSVLFNGIPFDQASDAEQLRVSIAIAGAMNPQLRVIRVRDGSLLDDEAMKVLEDYANEKDLQIWIERVDSSGEIGVVIEDGRVANVAEAAE